MAAAATAAAMDARTSPMEAVNTAELTKLIRLASDELDSAMRAPNVDYFAPRLEELRNNYLELFCRLLLRNPYSSIRKDVVSKMWFRTIYPPIEQYRANSKQFESMLAWSHNQQPPSTLAAAYAESMDPIAVRRELSRWRARFQKFLQATTGVLLRLVTELAETHAIVAAGQLANLEAFALDYRALAVHAYGFDFVDSLRTELHPMLSTVQRAALAIISRLLTYLGDLSRYRILYTSKKQSVASMVRAVSTGVPQYQVSAASGSSDGADSNPQDMWWPAKHFYRGAIKLAPHRGQSQNQLAVIYGYERNTLDGVFCYYRALTTLYRFRPSEANLRTLLDNAIRGIRSPGTPAATSPTGGYQYYDAKLYGNFTQLRFLFAIHQPTEKELGKLDGARAGSARAPITPEMELELVGDVGAACAKFSQGIKSGSLDERQILMTQAIHLFEQQQLGCFNVGDKETPLHDIAIARLSALLVARMAESMCFAVVGSINEAMQRARELKSEVDMVAKAARRGVPSLLVTLMWIVSASVRVARDSTTRGYLSENGAPITELKSQVFVAVRDTGLLRNASRLKDAMERAHGRVNRRSPPVPPLAWRDVLQSTAVLARRMWGADVAASQTAAHVEDQMLVGWQLPDGTVWGKQPPIAPESMAPGTAATGANETHIQQQAVSWWWQLHGLLSLVGECVPAVLAIIGREDRPMSPVVAAVSTMETAAALSHDPSRRLAAGMRSQDTGTSDNENDDGDDGAPEDDTICFQGRPRMPAPIPPPPSAAEVSPDAPASVDDTQSLPPTPDIAGFRSDFRAQAAVPLSPTPSAAPPPTPPPQPQPQSPPTLQRNFTEPMLAQFQGQQPSKHRGSETCEWDEAAASRMMDMLALSGRVAERRALAATATADTSVGYSHLNPGTLPLVDSARDEVISPVVASTYHRSQQPRSGAIGSQRTFGAAARNASGLPAGSFSDSGHHWPAAFSPSSAPTTAPVSPDMHGFRALYHHQYPYRSTAVATGQSTGGTSASSSLMYSPPQQQAVGPHAAVTPPEFVGGGGGWESLLHPQEQAPTLQQSSAAMDAWQQYQIEHQRKLVLKQQLDQQHKIQAHLHQQLSMQNQQQQMYQRMAAAAAASVAAAQDSSELDATTASVLHMALSTPAQDGRPADIYAAYHSNMPWALASGYGGGNRAATTSSGTAPALSVSSVSNHSNIPSSLQMQNTFEWCS